MDVVWHSFQLDPGVPAGFAGSEVDYLVHRKGMTEPQVRQMIAHVARQAAGEGLEYDFDSLVVANTLAAHRLLHLAARRGRAGDVKEALADPDVLVAIAAGAGLDPDEARGALDDAGLAAGVEADFAAARRIGVTGVPFFVLDGRYAVSGAQPPEVFREALDRAWGEAHPREAGAGDAAAACGPDGCTD